MTEAMWIATGLGTLGFFGTATAAIFRFLPRKNNSSPPSPVPSNPTELVTKVLCDERSKNIEARVERMHTYLIEVKKDILAEIRKKNH